MEEPKIRFAIDPVSGTITDAQAGILPKKEYQCIKCSGRLTINQGGYQTWHFRHYGDEEAKACPLYYGGHYENLLRELRVSDIEKAEAEKKVRLVVGARAFGKTLSFYGILPTLDGAEIPRGTTLDSALGSLSFTHKGLAVAPSPQIFHPSEPEARIELDPTADSISLAIGSPVIKGRIIGKWGNRPLKNGDVFVGERSRAERAESLKNLTDGETVFVIQGQAPSKTPASSEVFRLGGWHVVAFEFKPPMASYLESLSGLKARNTLPFTVDVVLPVKANPSSEAPMVGRPAARVLVAITPPEGMDPEFEVVSIPLERGESAAIPKMGPGRVRWFSTMFPSKDSRRLSVHWADRHRALIIHANPNELMQSALETKLSDERPVGIVVGGGAPVTQSAWDFKPMTVRRSKNGYTLADHGVGFAAPDGLRVNASATFPEGAKVGPTVRMDECTLDELNREFRVWAREGISTLAIDFGALGAAELRFEIPARTGRALSDSEIRAAIEAMNPIPKTVRWPLVRAICGAKPGTPHRALTGMKKRVRELLREVRANRR